MQRYVILERIAAGSMGEVFAAYDRTLDRKVALKLLLSSSGEDEARLTREAHAMARLSHPNVVAVFDSGVLDGRLFLAMEFVAGSTLREWQKARARGWREILRAYCDAGRGLAAAHAAGIVHRDFKPANVLVDDDGRVRVTDFGVARAAAGPPAGGGVAEPTRERAAPDVASSLETPVTMEGMVVGTPAYMAPEQWRAEAVDARSDQFAFCVALYEALYGARPFPGDDADARYLSMMRGQVRAAPRGTRVPAAVRRALLRGLFADRESRYPSMAALLGDLSRDPSRRWLQIAATAAAIAALAAVAAGVGHASALRQASLCGGAQLESDEVWGPDAQRSVEEGLLSTGVPYAADTWQRTRRNLDDYMASWRTMHRETCEATRVRAEQSEEVMTVRMACLGQRREEVAALARVLSHADRDVVAKAVSASMELTSLQTCREVTSLMELQSEPVDGAKRAELGAIRAGLAEVKANLDSGRNRAALDAVAPLVARARAVDHAPTTARALWLSSEAKSLVTTNAAAMEDARAAVLAADRGRDDALRATLETRLGTYALEVGNRDEAERWLDASGATLERIGGAGEARGRWLDLAGSLAYARGQPVEAVRLLQEAMAVHRASEASTNLRVKSGRFLAMVLASIARYDEAGALLDECDRSLAAASGADNPARLGVLVARAYLAGQVNDARGQLAYAETAIDLGERVAPDDTRMPEVFNVACDAHVRLGDYQGSLDECSRGVAAARRVAGPRSEVAALAENSMAEALVGLGRHAEAAELYEDAASIAQQLGAEGEEELAAALTGLGVSRLRTGKPREAIAVLERALSLACLGEGATPGAAPYRAQASLALAQALWRTGARGPRVDELTRVAVDTFRRSGREDGARDAETWESSRRR